MDKKKPEREKWLRLKGEKEIELVKKALSNERSLKAVGMPKHTERPKQREEIIEDLSTLERLEKQLE